MEPVATENTSDLLKHPAKTSSLDDTSTCRVCGPTVDLVGDRREGGGDLAAAGSAELTCDAGRRVVNLDLAGSVNDSNLSERCPWKVCCGGTGDCRCVRA